ncbi:MAG: cupin domain-containing protein [Pseudomonadota bacterium]
MISFEEALLPISLDDLREHYDEKKCLVVEGVSDKFHSLVSPADIERRINDGCNANSFPQVIVDGSRHSMVASQAVWSNASLQKSQFNESLAAGHSFMLSNSSQINPQMAAFIDELESFFEADKVHADVHLYVSTSTSGKSYNVHRDKPQHKILLQAYGETIWQLYDAKKEMPEHLVALADDEKDEWLEQVAEFALTEGDLLYMPPGTFHKVAAVNKPRISISIPFFGMEAASRMDRSYVPFAEHFLRGGESGND